MMKVRARLVLKDICPVCPWTCPHVDTESWGSHEASAQIQWGPSKVSLPSNFLFECWTKMLERASSLNHSQDVCAESRHANVRKQTNRVAADGLHTLVCCLSITVKSAHKSVRWVLLWSKIWWTNEAMIHRLKSFSFMFDWTLLCWSFSCWSLLVSPAASESEEEKVHFHLWWSSSVSDRIYGRPDSAGPGPGPEPSCVSLKSDQSNDRLITFKADGPSAAER